MFNLFKKPTFTIVTDTTVIRSDEPTILELLKPQCIVIFPRDVSFKELKTMRLAGPNTIKVTKDTNPYEQRQ